MLFRSDGLTDDRLTESLRAQHATEAVAGPIVGTQRKWVPSAHLTWKVGKKKYPDGRIFSKDTGGRPDNEILYEGYVKSPFPIFKGPTTRNELTMKAGVIGMELRDETKAGAGAGLKTGAFADELGGLPI